MICRFHGYPEALPDPANILEEGERLFPRRDYINSWILETDSRDLETETGSLEVQLRVHMRHDTMDYRITERLSQPGGPSQGGLLDTETDAP